MISICVKILMVILMRQQIPPPRVLSETHFPPERTDLCKEQAVGPDESLVGDDDMLLLMTIEVVFHQLVVYIMSPSYSRLLNHSGHSGFNCSCQMDGLKSQSW